MQLTQKEQEALARATKRGYDMNPWHLHYNELDRIHGAIARALTWGQFKRWRDNAPADFRRRFQDVARVTKSSKLLRLAEQGLMLVSRCESLESQTKTTKTET